MKKGVTIDERAKATFARAAPRRLDHLAEGEARPAQDDPDRRERERDVEGGHHRGERLGEAGPEEDEDEDQPDVVRLPDRRDRALDPVADRLGVGRAAGEELPEPRTEVGAAEDGVEGRPEQQDRGDGLGLAHSALPSRPGGSGGP